MTIRIKVSYECPQELERVLKRLGPDVKSWKAAREKGRFKRAYINIKPEGENDIEPRANRGE